MITVLGSVNVDLVMQLRHLPEVGETVLTPSFAEAVGGKGANQAIAAARDGAQVGFVRRKVSGGTRSDAGRDCRDAFLGLMKTCAKQAVDFWDYLGCRLDVPGAAIVPLLPALIRRAVPP